MKISTKGRYGLKALINLAMNDKQENITIKTLCENLNISERYLEQIFSSLGSLGLLLEERVHKVVIIFQKI